MVALTESFSPGRAALRRKGGKIFLTGGRCSYRYFAMQRNESVQMPEIMDFCKALADEQRLRILYALRNGELCVCQLIALLGLAPSTVSKHLTILRSARLIESRKSGRWMYYRLAQKFRSVSAGKTLKLLFRDMKKTDQIAKDQKRLKHICGEGLEAICRKIFCKP